MVQDCGRYPFIPTSARLLTSSLEAERHLQIHSSVVRARTERAASQRILLSEDRRADYAHRIPRVHIVEDVSSRNRKRQAVLMPGVVSSKRSASTGRPSASATAPRPADASKRDVRSASRIACRLVFLSKSKCFAQPQIQRKARRASATIDRYDGTRIHFVAVQGDVVRDVRVRQSSLQLRGRGTVIKNRIAVQILSERHIERRS